MHTAIIVIASNGDLEDIIDLGPEIPVPVVGDFIKITPDRIVTIDFRFLVLRDAGGDGPYWALTATPAVVDEETP